MTVGHLLVYIIYSIWSIISLYYIIKYPKALFKDGWFITGQIMETKLPQKYYNIINKDKDEDCLTGTQVWIVITTIILLIYIVSLIAYLFTIKI